jgi:hypothetical protein
LCAGFVLRGVAVFDWFVFTFCLYRFGVSMAKVFYGFRFNAKQYAAFKRLAAVGGLTVTGTFERLH